MDCHRTFCLIVLFLVFSTFCFGDDTLTCPSYGCKASGTFSYAIKPPKSNATIAWVAHSPFISIGNTSQHLGCIANNYNIICLASRSFEGLYIETGGFVTGDFYLHYPPLPLTDSSNEVYGSDGNYLMHYNGDGMLENRLPLISYNHSIFSLKKTNNDVIVIASSKGYILTFDAETNGTLLETMKLNGTIGRVPGLFLPIATPAVAGNRAYILTLFLAQSPSLKSIPDVVHRLFALDISNVKGESIKVAYSRDLEETMPLRSDPFSRLFKSQNVVELEQKDSENFDVNDDTTDLEPRIMCTDEIDRVYINIPESNTAGKVYGFQENGGDKMPTLMFQRSMSLAKMAMFSHSKNKTQTDLPMISRGKAERLENTKKKSKNTMIWGLQGNKEVIVGFDSINGTAEPTHRNISQLVGNRVIITSEVMVVGNSTNSSKDSLIFGLKRQTPIPSQLFTDLCDKHGVENNATSFLVQLTSEGISWMVSSPYDFEIKGQIAGVRNSLDSIESNKFGHPKDLMAAVAGNATRSAIFAVW